MMLRTKLIYLFIFTLLGGIGTAIAQKRLVHMGDSHIKYGYSSQPIAQEFPNWEVLHTGINGATWATYLKEENLSKVVAMEPDVLLISLGTNDSYSFRFVPEEMEANLNSFIQEIKTRLPKTVIYLTTPPPNYLKQGHRVRVGKGRRKRWRTSVSYHFNPNTKQAALLIREFGKHNGYEVFDLYSKIGGETETKEWLRKGLMHPDHVHYTQSGYRQHGQWMASALKQWLQ